MIYQPGDVLIYARTGFYARLIRMKTWSVASHCEVVAVGGVAPMTVASRDGQGVGYYELDAHGLYAVLRPVAPFNPATAWSWFRSVSGQKYDWIGLLAFFSAKLQGKENNRQFCSEFACRFLRHGGVEPFTPETDADAVAPSDFLKSGALRCVWQQGVARAAA
jgi:hypothetical protein